MKTPGLGNLQMAYMDMLRLPHGAVRVQMQNVLCQLRDQIAELTGEDGETVQNKYEAAVMATAPGDALLSALKFYANPSSVRVGARWNEDYPGGITYPDGDNFVLDTGEIARAAIAQATPAADRGEG